MLCRVAVQTSRGWYVSHHDTPCYGLPALCEVTTTEVLDFRWADEIGLGVLLVRAANGDVCNGPTFSKSFLFCGMGPENVPRCTTAMTDGCNILAPFAIAGGQVVLQDEGRTDCINSATPVASGRYTLDLLGAVPGPRPWEPPASEGELPDPVVATQAYGPFSSVSSYCADPPTFGDPSVGEQHCAQDAPVWRGTVTGPGGLSSVELLYMEDDLWGAPLHHCRVALQTAAGWFVTTEPRICEGTTGASSERETRLRALRWLAPRPVVLVDALSYRYDVDFGGYIEPAPGDYAAGATTGSTTNDAGGKSGPRKIRLCGVGPSGVPSCTSEILAGCVREDGQATHEIHFDGSMLELTQTNDPPDEFDCELERARYRVVFP